MKKSITIALLSCVATALGIGVYINSQPPQQVKDMQESSSKLDIALCNVDKASHKKDSEYCDRAGIK